MKRLSSVVTLVAVFAGAILAPDVVQAAGSFHGKVTGISYDQNYPNWFIFDLNTASANSCGGLVVAAEQFHNSTEAVKGTYSTVLAAFLAGKTITVNSSSRDDGNCQVLGIRISD